MKKTSTFLAAAFLAVFVLLIASPTHADVTKVVAPAVSVTFGVASVQGTAPFTYQWQKNGVNIPGATAAAYNIPSVSAADTGTYVCVISNAAGSAPTDKGFFTVAVLPSGQITITSP
jgi:hypothetical protein